ncbi:MAG: adenylyl-sulfate reductase subunit alpha [Chloroflexi bacterium]|nr:adenylyl-sulfate reductase subunit alpha [Chloroflexota bacterium]
MANEPQVEIVETDVLVVGGGMSGTGAAYEAAYWAKAKGQRVVLVEKAAIERSGAVAQGLSAINMYLGMRWGENVPDDFVHYVRNETMGLAREDLSYDIARHVDATVHMFEDWGLPFFKNAEGRYVREGRWQVMIHGESYKPIVAEAAKLALGDGNLFERVFVSHLLTDANDPNKIAGAIGFSVREYKVYVFKAKAVICTSGGAVNVWRPHAVGEGMGRAWYTVFNNGSVYALPSMAGAEMTQMEHRLVQARFKDGYGPVGMWFLMFKAKAKNAFGEEYEITRADELQKYAPYGTSRPIPSPLRNHLMMLDIQAGKGPIYMRTDEAMQAMMEGKSPQERRTIESDAWEDFLDMTISQALLWASMNIDPAKTPSELVLTEPYIMGSHATGSGAWVSGPEDVSPSEYFWGYNRMTTVQGLFAAGDGAGGSPHKFSSGSYTEGRLAAKGAVAFVVDNPAAPNIDQGQVDKIVHDLYEPFRVYEQYKDATTREEINPNYFLPKMGLLRLQKIMDEYAGGYGSNYGVNGPTLERGLEHIQMMKEDFPRIAARNLHELLRVWETWHRLWCGEVHMRHLLERKETRWPGYYYRLDYPQIDDQNWHVFLNSRYDPATGAWEFKTKPYIPVVP